jgi:hypothetical protein
MTSKSAALTAVVISAASKRHFTPGQAAADGAGRRRAVMSASRPVMTIRMSTRRAERWDEEIFENLQGRSLELRQLSLPIRFFESGRMDV